MAGYDNINDERKEIPEILLISNNENNHHDSKPQNVELFKFLVWWNTALWNTFAKYTALQKLELVVINYVNYYFQSNTNGNFE